MLSEIFEMLDVDKTSGEMCVTFIANKGAVIQGYKKVVNILEDKIVVMGKNKRQIEVVGKYLEIFSLAPSEIVVHGKITGVFEDEQNRQTK